MVSQPKHVTVKYVKTTRTILETTFQPDDVNNPPIIVKFNGQKEKIKWNCETEK